MASFTFDAGSFGLQGASGGTAITWGANTIKARIVKSSVTPSQTAIVMTGITKVTGTTDQTLGSKTQTNDTTNHRTVYDAADPTWSAVASGDTIGWIVVYKFITDDTDSVPIFCVDVTDTPTNGLDVLWTISANGIGFTQQ